MLMSWEGGFLLDGRCRVDRITLDGTTNSTKLSVSCSSGESEFADSQKKHYFLLLEILPAWSKDMKTDDKQKRVWWKEYKEMETILLS